ncbi:MAG: DUF885 domain-containing protein [Pseudomonadota bacterium]
MRSLLVALLATTALVACETSIEPQTDTIADAVPEITEQRADGGVVVSQDEEASDPSETDRINAWLEEQFEEQLAFSPMFQTFLGRKTNLDKIDDLSIEAEEAQLEWFRASVAEMKASFDYDALDPEAQISYDIWAYQLAQDEAASKFRTNTYVFEQMQAVQSFFPQLLIAFHPATNYDELAAYISRIKETERAIDQLIVRSKANAETGVRPPLFAFEFVLEEANKIITGAPFDDGDPSDIWADFQRKVQGLLDAETITQEQADGLLADAETALVDNWKPAYERLITWQEEDIVNASAVATGVGALPNGQAYYNERLANQTTTNLTADEIHEIGLAEVARLRSEMEAIKEAEGFEGTLKEYFNYLRDTKDDERLYFPDTDEGRQAYIDEATAAIENIKGKLPEYFGLLPKADLIVKRVEAFREQDGAAQHYFPPTPDGARPGIYYAHLSDMKALPKRELEVIAYHEGLPGHHMQIAIAQELEGIPTFRTQANFTAYTEGWGLYSELLASEIPGTYVDNLSKFGRLGSEIWRAIRLVVDTGLHAKGWTEEEALAYFLENAAAPETQARSEVRRYMVLPGQATSYKIGMLKILDLRTMAEAELGDAFDIRAFHDIVLSGGAMPLDVLEARVDRWVSETKDG